MEKKIVKTIDTYEDDVLVKKVTKTVVKPVKVVTEDEAPKACEPNYRWVVTYNSGRSVEYECARPESAILLARSAATGLEQIISVIRNGWC